METPAQRVRAELARRGRTGARGWGKLNALLAGLAFDFAHGSPAWKRHGAPPAGAESARPPVQSAMSHARFIRAAKGDA